ncbi:MAG TPA: hypothetical protein PKK00_09590 [Bacteroidales bacterium]|nr:hypothetical protein [Bacteroidales bacterium]HPS15874.1 hypothetical protein [Bacteroidales bacterium]
MKNKKFCFAFLLMLVFSAAMAQTHVSSPYTRFGLGDLLNNKYIRNTSMGGISFGYRNPTSVNYSNPASYTAFDTLSFVFETGLNSNFMQLESSTEKHLTNYTSLSYLVFGFPVTKWWGASIGLLPYSNVGYDILHEDTLDNIGTTDYTYEGNGGLNQFYFGNAFRIKNLSIGFNASYIFGSLNKLGTVSFPDSIYFLSTKIVNSTRVNDLFLNYGMQYQKNISKNVKMVTGFVYNANANLNAKQDLLIYRFLPSNDGAEDVVDTIIYSEGSKGTITIPQSIGAGVTFGINNKLLMGADYQFQNWKKFKSFGESDSLLNSMQASFGLEYIPNLNSLTQKWKHARYRFGLRYNETYLQLHNTQLNETAVSFGIGIPMKRSKSTLNLGFELGQRGTTDNNLIRERFAKVVFSLSVHEYWFIKRRFD